MLVREDIARGLRGTGLKPGDVVLVHSAMRTFGPIDGGAETVIAAFLDVIGARGTLVAPTFTFAHEGGDDPVIDPAADPSEMGIITETLRRHPDALRSTAYRHSFAALGHRARVITEVDPALSSFDLRSTFGVMLALDAQIVLLGLTYANSTSHHFAEFVCDVPYRHTIPMTVRVRRPDGAVARQPMVDYQPKPGAGGEYYGSRRPDFNRLGRMLEEQGTVGMSGIGNCAVRRFSMRDLVDLAQVEAARDYNIFRTPEGRPDYCTPLDFGTVVLSPEMLDAAGRPGRNTWCVMDPSRLKMPG